MATTNKAILLVTLRRINAHAPLSSGLLARAVLNFDRAGHLYRFIFDLRAWWSADSPSVVWSGSGAGRDDTAPLPLLPPLSFANLLHRHHRCANFLVSAITKYNISIRQRFRIGSGCYVWATKLHDFSRVLKPTYRILYSDMLYVLTEFCIFIEKRTKVKKMINRHYFSWRGHYTVFCYLIHKIERRCGWFDN